MATMKSNYTMYVVLLAIGAVVLGYWLIIVPQLAAAKNDTMKATALMGNVKVAEKRYQVVKTIEETINKNKSDYDLLTNALPNDNDVGGALVTLDALAAKTGVSVASIDPGKGDSATGLLQVSIHIQGGYQNLVDFMKTLEKNLRPITIQSATLTKAEQAGGKFVLDGTFALHLLFTATPSPDQPANQPTQPATQE